MAIALQSTGTLTEQTTAGTTINVAYPATLDSSSILVLFVALQTSSLPTLPSGWTQVYRNSGTGGTAAPALMVAIKQATGSETGTLAVTTPSVKSIGQMLAFSGVDLTTPQDATATSIDQSSALATSPIPSLTTTLQGATLVYAGGTNSSTSTATAPTGPAAFTETGDRGSGTIAGTMGYLIWSGFGATGTVSITWSGTPKSVAALLALRPAITSYSGAVAMTGTASLTVGGSVTSSTAVTMTETSSLTVGAKQTLFAAVAMTATSSLTVAADIGYTLHSYEEGTDGAAVPNSANDVIALVGAPTYAAASAVHGTLGVHGGTANAMLGYALPNVAGSSGSVYAKVNTLPTSGSRDAFVKFTDSSNTTLGSISINLTSGTFCIVIGGTVYATSTVSVAAGDVFRLDWQRTWDGTNMGVTARLFLRSNSEGRTADQQITATHTSSTPARVFVGVSVSTTWDVSFDTLRLYSSLTWPLPYNPAITPGTVTSVWTGDPLETGFVLVAHTAGATSLRLAVSTSNLMTSPVYFAAQTPNSDNRTTHVATGLSPDTAYHYQLLDTPIGGTETAIGTPALTRTTPAAGSPANFNFGLGSCQVNNSIVSAAWDDAVNWNPHFFLHVGDFHYRAIVSTDPSDHAAGLATQIANAAGLKNALASMPVIYTNSDGEQGPNNGDSNTAWNAAFNTAYTTTVPSRLVDTLPSPVGKYRTWVVGRIRFILIDDRTTDRSPGAAVDDSSKTMLGATQKAWLKTQLLQSEPVKFIVGNAPWVGTATGFQWQDKWSSYQTERQELADFITLNRVQVAYFHGDAHYLGVDAGSHNAWGGFPNVDGSPLDNVGSTTDATFWDATYGALSPTSSYSQYQRISITDDGVTITMSVSGWDALNNTQRVAMTYSWSNVKAGTVAMTETSSLTVAGKRTQPAAVQMVSVATMSLETSDPRVIGTISLRRNTPVGAAASNPLLGSGEPGWDGDGIRVGAIGGGSHWNTSPQTLMEGAGTLAVKTTSYAAAAADRLLVGNGSSITITLPAASSVVVGRRYVVKNIHSSSLTVASAGGTVDGASSISLAQWAKATVVSDGTNWLTI